MNRPFVHHEAVKNVRLLLMDVDGVLTDGRLYFGVVDDRPAAFKAFHVRDGLGISLLHRAGIQTGIVSGRSDAYVRRRAEELGMAIVVLGEKSKGSAVEKILASHGVPREEVAFVADDVNDIPALSKVGVTIAVADAHPDVLSFVQLQTRAPGGNGAVREIADAILGVESATNSEGAAP